LAPLCNAAAMVEVARNASIITTMLLLTSYKFKSAGERHVYRDGLFFNFKSEFELMISHTNGILTTLAINNLARTFTYTC